MCRGRRVIRKSACQSLSGNWLRQIRWTTFLTGVPLLLARTPLAHAGTVSAAINGQDGAPATTAAKIAQSFSEADQPLVLLSGQQENIEARPVKLEVGPPEGFEDLDGPIQTYFDVFYRDERIGLFEGTLEDGLFTFSNPAELALQLPDINPAEVEDFLSTRLDANESLRCLPGDQTGCGTLRPGESGVVVDPERFRVSLFLGREYLVSIPSRDLLLGDPVSRPSLIQNIAGSISASSQSEETTRFGVALDTYASVGKTSVVSRINADDSRGLRWQEAYGQHYFKNMRVAGGLIRDEGSANLSSATFYGAELSSFDRRDGSQDNASGTVLDIVLPTASRVEIYRNGTLVSARQYAAGLQVLDTNGLPIGSYPVRIVARDSSGIILDETRTFSKTPDLPPPGETNFSVKVGVRATEGTSFYAAQTQETSFLPESTGESLVSVSASRRLTRSSAARLGVTAVDGDLYPEAELQFYKGELRGTAAIAIGPEDQYSAYTNLNFQIGDITTSLSARKTEANLIEAGQLYDPEIYRPFFQSETSVFGSLATPAFGGSLGLRAGYSESDLAAKRETFGLNYTRPFRTRRFGQGIMTFDAVSSSQETRVGIRFTFRRSLGRNSSLNGAAGFDYSQYDDDFDRDTRADPLALLGYTRSGQFRGAAVTTNAEAGTSNGESRLTFGGSAASRRGEADIIAGVSSSRDNDEADVFLASNLQTGFLVEGSRVQFGMLGFGDAAVLVEVPEDRAADHKSDGRFRVTVGNQAGTTLKVGESASILVPSLASATVGLVPEDAPPFDIDLSPRKVPLYPGNVVRMTWEATYVVSAIGRLMDEAGNPIANAIVRSDADLAVTNEQGYFSISGNLNEYLQVRTQDGTECPNAVKLVSETEGRNYLRLGDIVCVLPPKTAQAEPERPQVPAVVAQQTPAVRFENTAVNLKLEDSPHQTADEYQMSQMRRALEKAGSGHPRDEDTPQALKVASLKDAQAPERPNRKEVARAAVSSVSVTDATSSLAAEAKKQKISWKYPTDDLTVWVEGGNADRLMGAMPASRKTQAIRIRNAPGLSHRLEGLLAALETVKCAVDQRDLLQCRDGREQIQSLVRPMMTFQTEGYEHLTGVSLSSNGLVAALSNQSEIEDIWGLSSRPEASGRQS